MHLKIAVLPGDYIGPEVMAAALPVLEAVLKKSGHTLEHSTHDVGGAGIDHHGKALPDSTLEACRAADAILFGSVGGPKWEKLPPAEQPERASLLPLRKHFTLYANVRPGLLLKNLIDTSPIRPDRIPNGVDMVCIRELTGGLYFGPKSTKDLDGGDIESIDTMVYRKSEIERITDVAIATARARRKQHDAGSRTGLTQLVPAARNRCRSARAPRAAKCSTPRASPHGSRTSWPRSAARPSRCRLAPSRASRASTSMASGIRPRRC